MRYLIFVLLAGCASISWDDRVGNYTYNEAVRDYGPADTCRSIDTGQACTWTRGGDRLILVFDRDNYLTAAEDD